ncbi:YbjQ family protein [Gemmatimonadota bacterium]
MSTPTRYSHDWPELWQIEDVMSRTTTTFGLEGYRVVKTYGMVRGIMVRSRSIIGTIGASLETIFGGNITLFTELCEKTRREAFEIMVAHAIQTGANAVIGVRYDATELMKGVSEVLCYGTAVVVEPTYGEEASGQPEA